MCNDLPKKKLKNSNIKEYLNYRIKRLYCLKIIETKQNIYDYTIKKYKRNMGCIKKKKKSMVITIEICQTVSNELKKY